MIFLRALAFNAFFLAWTLLLTILYQALLPFPRRVLVGAVTWWSRTIQAALQATVGLGLVIRGREHLPLGACIVAAKHQSAWDTVAIMFLIDDPAVVLKRELLRLPLWGWLARHCRMIGVDRGAGAAALKALVAEARACAAQNRKIVIFPQGTRTAPGVRRGYLPGVAALYEFLALPVVPVALNSGLFWGRRAFTKRPGTITVEFLPPIAPGLRRADFMAELERRIETASARLAGEDKQGIP